MPVKPIPDGYHTITPYLVVRDASKTVEFAKKAFGAEISFEPMRSPDGKIMHAEMKIGDSRVMIGDANEKYPPTEATLHLYVPNVDAIHQRAVAAGGVSTMEPADQFYGDRGASVKDPNGVSWYIATHVEDVDPDDLKKRAETAMKEQQNKAA